MEDNQNKDFNPVKLFTKKELCYYIMIDKYYKNHCSVEDITEMLNIINGLSDISLRVMDWFVTKFSKKSKMDFIGRAGDTYDVHINYKAQLKSYKKIYFDPFKRRVKFTYTFKKINTSLYTTIGQLNFFRWAITNGVITYIKTNFEKIIKEMTSCNKEEKIMRIKYEEYMANKKKNSDKDGDKDSADYISDCDGDEEEDCCASGTGKSSDDAVEQWGKKTGAKITLSFD